MSAGAWATTWADAARAIVDELSRPGEEVMPAKASRAAFGEALLELGARDERIVTLDADLSKSTMTVELRQEVSRAAPSTSASPSRT